MIRKNMLPSVEAVAAGVWRLRFGTPEELVPTSLRAAEPQFEALNALPAVTAEPLDTSAITCRIDNRGVLLELPLRHDEDFYGGGLLLKHLRQTGRKQRLRVTSDPVTSDGSGHAPVPLYLSTAGYGVLVDTARQATFCFGGHAREGARGPERTALADSEAALYDGDDAVRGHHVQVEVPRCAGVDVYVFAGPDLRGALQRYVLWSGGGCMPPAWGLGVWYRAHVRSDHAAALCLADHLLADGIQATVFGLEPGWQTHSYSCSLAWDHERFPRPSETAAALRDRGMHLNLWQHAFVHPSSPAHAALRPHSGDHLVWDGLVPDVTTAAARDHFAAHCRELVKQGVSGFKLDECDGSDNKRDPWSWPDHAHFPGGGDGEQLHALYGQGYMLAIQQACGDEPTYGQVRSAGALSSPLPYVLYSDLYNHREFLRGVCSAGLSGLLWTPELRHADSHEDLIRRLQALVLAPQFLINAWYVPHPPWHQPDRVRNQAGELLPEDERTALTELVAEICAWRARLVPYLRTAFARYAQEGVPPFRPLLCDYPEDLRLREVDDAWLIGDELLVAPLVAGEAERSLSLPAGDWYDFETGTHCPGGTDIVVTAKTGLPPVLVRAGAVIPLAVDGGIELRAYGGALRDAALWHKEALHAIRFGAVIAGELPVVTATRFGQDGP
ncbi:MAG: glycoside hydrolase [Planctomycetota bacterium]|jgi:alpha-D-xyloside xylohydrolase|nr:glycoside hydrolase [Planctomycetota bacterium]